MGPTRQITSSVLAGNATELKAQRIFVYGLSNKDFQLEGESRSLRKSSHCRVIRHLVYKVCKQFGDNVEKTKNAKALGEKADGGLEHLGRQEMAQSLRLALRCWDVPRLTGACRVQAIKNNSFQEVLGWSLYHSSWVWLQSWSG